MGNDFTIGYDTIFGTIKQRTVPYKNTVLYHTITYLFNSSSQLPIGHLFILLSHYSALMKSFFCFLLIELINNYVVVLATSGQPLPLTQKS